ncbi:thiosulfate sulfurtransferase/rhodanese-like domain-containing protein 3 [Clupea harengus]|uniref:Thiosulfate sulfurtransferase/rhodanese-like domain-containing protein 3 n=1 Tax=Clupea harengus TaxID=7950 RepID=A0A6P3VSR5_CLUHA|nr:thiosulfate sulfurtransferase/rhodanese-like domain-containing protein 3 [Clupea harengus]
MALNSCLKVSRIIPRVLHRNVIHLACATRTLKNSLGTHSLCVQYTPAVTCRGKTQLRNFSSSKETDVSYEQLKKLLAAGTASVIDVREPWELREYGNIPGSINVPLGQVSNALQLSPEDFKEKYGGTMPSQTENVVFTCLAGVRSKTALDTAASLGYSKVKHFPGGWQDWAKHEILQTKE